MTDFGPGDLVKCICDFDVHPYTLVLRTLGYVVPIRGTIYTVRGIVSAPGYCCDGVLLEELRNPPVRTSHGVTEVSFARDGFVPICDERLDVFRRIAVDQDQDKEEELV